MIKKEDLQSAIGSFLGIGLVAFISKSIDDDFLLAPFGATSIIVFLSPDSEYAQPRNIILGYIITSIVGTVVVFILGHNWFSYALAIAISMLVKISCQAVHPPSAAMPIILIKSNERGIIDYILSDVFPGLILLVVIAVVYNRYILEKDYPLWRKKV